MSMVLGEQILTALAQFSSATRLYELQLGRDDADPGAGVLLVEAFAADDAVDAVGARDVIALSTNAHIDLRDVLGQPATLAISLPDGTRTTFNGGVTQAAMLGSEGGLARYRLRLTPWSWRLTQGRNSRVWQDMTIVEIVDAVFGDYAPLAQWRWSSDAHAFLAEVPARSYCCQYRESDHDFVRRLLTEEGISWRVEQVEDGHRMVLFADSTLLDGVPRDASSSAGGGIRFHGARAGEQQDTVQALQAHRTLTSTLVTVASYDYKAKKVVAASAPSLQRHGSLPDLESYDVPGQYAYVGTAVAQHYAQLQIQACEARGQLWSGRSTVRTLAAGTRIDVTGSPLAAQSTFTVLRVTSVGVNNLPAPAQQGLA